MFTPNRRDEAIVPLREAAASGDADALVEIFEWHKSWERGDLAHVQIVKRDEAANALRKAAELGNPFAMHRLAVILERGEMVKRDNAQAIYWAERSLQKPDGEWGDADIATLLGRLLTQSDDPAQRARGIDIARASHQSRPPRRRRLACDRDPQRRPGAGAQPARERDVE